jgi:glycosyltransferase involved in cell wall biosynthesis
MQNYTNYHIVVLDDGSTDQTPKLIQQYLKNQFILPPNKYEVIVNKNRKYAMPNLRMAAKTKCKPD